MSTSKAHAMLAPSAADRWMVCTGSVAMEAPLPDDTSEYADEGTAAHELAKWCLTQGKNAHAFQGRRIEIVNGVYYPGTGPLPANLFGQRLPIRRMFECDEDMATHVQKYVRLVCSLAMHGELLVEQKLPIGHITGEEGATGTSDAVILATRDDELIIVDLKFGRGVKVYAERNRQGMMYALGALEEYALLSDWKKVRIIICQPRLDHIDEFTCTVGDLVAFAKEAAGAAWDAMAMLDKRIPLQLAPSLKGCMFCKANAECPAKTKFVADAVGADFDVLSQADDSAGDGVTVGEVLLKDVVPADPVSLATKMKAIEIIEDWCKAVRARVESNLLAGVPVPGYKLVQGKRGNRAWTDAGQVERLFKSFRLKTDQMYTYTLISPATAEKVLKAKPKQWAKAVELIGQADGKASVAEESDKRPALKLNDVAADFANVEVGADLV